MTCQMATSDFNRTRWSPRLIEEPHVEVTKGSLRCSSWSKKTVDIDCIRDARQPPTGQRPRISLTIRCTNDTTINHKTQPRQRQQHTKLGSCMLQLLGCDAPGISQFTFTWT
ncbi:hypothetical protein H310_10301 [Aphanomyces invadans]|uniref:Uncharacterized protein n=1 Tax=Aphanomyces invadans TaxID=157072 RepID=A0A024TRG5_9STRA|nr:hypothetical protein H310_10301 [Aphanomyces invadans]ETV96599.1 hypothetical protein H310_10301 [Aphanomyces invadans]|eukprot:XP_008874862.1 hypothetical protein H310_10301 [Aphanomyces invadans]